MMRTAVDDGDVTIDNATAACEFFFGCTFDLVSQNSINYACVVTVLLCPNYAIMPNPTPTNFRIAQELQFQHADCTSKAYTKCPTVLYASSFFNHPHWPQNCLL